MVSLLLAQKILSLLLMAAAGWLLVRLKLLRSQDSLVLSKIILYLVLPCVSISAFQVEGAAAVRDGFFLALGAAVGSQALMIVLARLLRPVLKLDPVETANAVYSNAGNLIIPVVTSLLGPEYVIYTCAYIAVEQVLFWTHCKMTLCGERKVELKKIFGNVNMIALAIGAVLFFTGFRLPTLLDEAVDGLAGMVGPLSMLVTGMLIGGMKLKSILAYKRIWLVAALRLIVFPLVCLALMRLGNFAALVPEGERVLMISLLAISGPASATVTQMAQLYGRDADYAGANNVVTTVLCAVTMPAMIWLYQL